MIIAVACVHAYKHEFICCSDCQRELLRDIIFRGQLHLPVMSLARKQLVYELAMLTTFISVTSK